MKMGLPVSRRAFEGSVSNHCVEMDGNCRAKGVAGVSAVMERLFAVDEESRQVGWRAKEAMPLWDRDGRNVGR